MNIKEKNVAIPAHVYRELLEMGFTSNYLLAKRQKEKDRIKSPLSHKFIHINTPSYMKLLTTYTEEKLLSFRDGFIQSPDNGKLIRVYGKTFNLLAKEHDLESMLNQPRMPRGDDMIGMKYNNYHIQVNTQAALINKLKTMKAQHDIKMMNTKATLIEDGVHYTLNEVSEHEEKVDKKVDENLDKKPKNKIVKEEKEIDYETLITTKSINKLIEKENVIVFSSSTYKQYDEDRDLHTDGLYCSAAHFENGKNDALYDLKELRIGEDVLMYHLHHKIYNTVGNIDEHHKYLFEDNEESLINTKVDDIDLLSIYKLLKKKLSINQCKVELLNRLEKRFHRAMKETSMFNIAVNHMWFFTQAKRELFNNPQYKHTIDMRLVLEEDKEENQKYDNKYEQFEENIVLKERFTKEIVLSKEILEKCIHDL